MKSECFLRRGFGVGEPPLLVANPGESIVGLDVGSHFDFVLRELGGSVEIAVVIGEEQRDVAIGPLAGGAIHVVDGFEEVALLATFRGIA